MDCTIELDWGAFFARYEAMSVRFARGLAGADVAGDLFQEAARAVFERASSGKIEFESVAHARNYLFQVLRHLAADAKRALERGIRSTDRDGIEPSTPWSAPDLTAIEERDRAVRAAVDRLRADERVAIEQRYFAGLTYREMSVRSGSSISTLQARVESALRKIRSRVGNSFGAE